MELGLKQAYSLGIIGVLLGTAILLTATVALLCWILKKCTCLRASWFFEKIIFPLQYIICVALIVMAIIAGSSLNIWNVWISFIWSSVFIVFAWIHFHRKESDEYLGFHIKDLEIYTPLNEESINLMTTDGSFRKGSYRHHIPIIIKRFSRDYIFSLCKGIRQKRMYFIGAVLFSLLISAILCIVTLDLCIAIRPLATSTRFTRYFSKEYCKQNSICNVYFTVADDISTSIIINFHSHDEPIDSFVNFTAIGSSEMQTVQANWFKMEHLKEIDRYVYWAEITGLRPGSAYQFTPHYVNRNRRIIGTENTYKMRTAPANGNVTWVAGGDMQMDNSGFTISRVAASHEPYFAIIGGDIAYANSNVHCYRRWDYWFETWDIYMRTPLGFSVPVSLAIGNHESGNHIATMNDRATTIETPFFFHYFPQYLGLSGIEPISRNPYHSHKVSNHSMYLILDSGMIASMRGKQWEWMNEKLSETKSVNKFASYHYALYPSILHEYTVGKKDKEAWTSTFDRYNLTVAFEHHFHVFKRTKPIRQDAVSEDGVIYLGDGAWGILSDDVFLNTNSWYISEASRTPHVYVVTASEKIMHIKAMDSHNKVITSLTKVHDNR